MRNLQTTVAHNDLEQGVQTRKRISKAETTGLADGATATRHNTIVLVGLLSSATQKSFPLGLLEMPIFVLFLLGTHLHKQLIQQFLLLMLLLYLNMMFQC